MTTAAIISLILQLEPPVQAAITALVTKYQSATTPPTTQQIEADLAALDADIATFDAS